jgi:hypothetical protein
MRWPRRRREPEAVPYDDLHETVTDIDARLEDAGRQLAESRSRAARAQQIAEESARLVARNSITALIRDSIITPHARS